MSYSKGAVIDWLPIFWSTVYSNFFDSTTIGLVAEGWMVAKGDRVAEGERSGWAVAYGHHSRRSLLDRVKIGYFQANFDRSC
jgi:hypothetical protein